MNLDLARRYGWNVSKKDAYIYIDDILFVYRKGVIYSQINDIIDIVYDGNKDNNKLLSMYLDVGIPYVEQSDGIFDDILVDNSDIITYNLENTENQPEKNETEEGQKNE